MRESHDHLKGDTADGVARFHLRKAGKGQEGRNPFLPPGPLLHPSCVPDLPAFLRWKTDRRAAIEALSAM
jgi:hypothetical protein